MRVASPSSWPGSASIALVLGVGVAAGSCARCSGRTDGAAATASASASMHAEAAIDGGAPARCVSLGGSPRWGGDPAGPADPADSSATSEGAPMPFAAEIGGAAALGDAFYVGARASGPTGATAVLRLDVATTTVTTLASWPATPGARAPLVAVAPGRVIVGRLSDADGARTLRVEQLVGGAAPAPLGVVTEGLDESEATSLVAVDGGALVAWDDADPTHSFGRVRVVRLDTNAVAAGDAGEADAAAVASRDVISPSTSDAAWPALIAAASANRAVLLWLAERPESAPIDAGEEGAGEPSQAEAMRWVEAVVVDTATGRALGAPRALTARDGHAQTFGATTTAQGLFVAVRDDARPTDAEGGTLLAVHATLDDAGAIGEPRATVVDTEDLAPGVPFVAALGGAPFAAIAGLRGDQRWVPMLADDLRSKEPVLDGRRVIAAWGERVLAVRAAGPAVEMSLVQCHR